MKKKGIPTESDLSIGSFVREGLLHQKIDLGCQDACHIVNGWSDLKVAVVCDGCSSGHLGISQNQVGAILGAQYIASTLATLLRSMNNANDFKMNLQITRSKTHSAFRRLCNSMGLSFYKKNKNRYRVFVIDKPLFTVLGFAIFRDYYWIFGLGDGCYSVNGKIEILDAARYLNRSLLRRGKLEKEQFKIYARGKIDNLEHLWISSDGLTDFLSNPSRLNDFNSFLADELTCARNSKGEDTTIQAFNRKVYNHYKRHFSDDIALALVK